MQSGGGRRHGAVMAGVDGLIVAPVAGVGALLARDIGRQGRRAVAAQGVGHGLATAVEAQANLAALPLGHDLGGEILAEAQAVADLELARRLGERIDRLMQGRLDAQAAAPAGEPHRDDPGVVEHQHVAGRQQLRQVGETPIVETLLADPQQAGGIPRIRGTRGDQLARQFEIEQIDPHRAR